MDRTKRKSNILDRLTDMTIPSDNTQVVSPYRMMPKIEPKPSITRANRMELVRRINEAGRKQKEEADEKEWREQQRIAKAEAEAKVKQQERDRIRANEDAYRKKQAEKQRLYEEQKKLIEANAEKERKLKDLSYEKDYKWWFEDVKSHPSKYNTATRVAVEAANLTSIFDPFARTIFGLKNRAGNIALNSIDTNGTRLQGEMSLREHELDAANTHQYRVSVLQSIQDLLDLLANYDAGSPEYAQILSNIRNLNALLLDPTSKKFDDDYKLSYVINKSGMWDSFKKAYRNYISGFTYDQYKDLINERNYKQDVDQYYNTLVDNDQNNKLKKSNKFEFSRVNPYAINYSATHKALTNKTLASYTNRELLDLDAKNTTSRRGELQEELKAYQKQYAENRQHLAESMKYWEISEYFKHGVKAHQNDPLTSLGYWGYAIYPMLGSTFSSPEQLVSTVAQGASMAGFASTPYTGGAGAVAGAGAGILAGYYGIQSGFAENTTEAGLKRIDNFKELLSDDKRKETIAELKERSKHYWKNRGWNDKQIKEYLEGEEGDNRAINDYFTGLTKSLKDENGQAYVRDNGFGFGMYTNPIADPEVRNAELYSTQGLRALYDADNARTVMGNLFQTLVSITPTGSARKAFFAQMDKLGSRILSKEALNETVKDATGRVTAKTTGKAAKSFSKTLAEGYARGAQVGEMAGFGFPGEIIGGSVGALANATARIGIDKLPTATRNLLRSFENGVMHKYQDIYDKLLPNSKFGKALAIYGGRAAKTTAASMMSEAAEEAVQYLNSKENYAEKYGWGGMSIGDALINDIYQGTRVFNSYGALLGITNSDLLNDAEYWSNVQGGFALGGLHTGTIRIGAEGFNAYKEIPTHSAILESAVMNRELDKKDRASNVEFARQAMRNRTNETLSVLDWMEKNDSRREEPMFTSEDYAEKRKAAERIGQMVKDKTLRAKLEAKGIVYGTEEYANAIADKYALQELAIQNNKEQEENNKSLQAVQNSKEYQDEAASLTEFGLADDLDYQLRVTEAGNKAVAAEKERAIAAGEDVETSDFKRNLQDIRKTAQEQEQARTKASYKNDIINFSRLANRLKSLIKLRALHNTVEDFFWFLQDKFNLKVRRPDAKLITQSVDNLIQQLKEALKEGFENFDSNMSDADVLDFIEKSQIIKSGSEDIERIEIANAMLQADREVINKHLNMFEEGLIRKQDGTYEYNPAEYKARRLRADKLNKDLSEGKINLEQYLQLQNEQHESIPYNSKDVDNNPLKKRIKAIIDARKDDKALEHMADDIENGDGVVRILNELSKEDTKSNTSEEAKEAAKKASESFDFEDDVQQEATPIETHPEVSETAPTVSELLTPKLKYDRRKQRATESYKKRKKTLRDIRKNAFASIVPIPTPLLNLANYLISKAEIGTYKIAQFAEEFKNAAKARGFNANDFISGIKEFYINKAVAITDPSVLENFSAPKEIVDFHYSDEMTIKRPVIVTGNVQAMLEQIDKETEKINKTLSSHYDTVVNQGNTVVVYPNREAFINARFGEHNAFWDGVYSELVSANTSDEEFRNKLNNLFQGFLNIPIDEYVKYRNVEGIILAITNVRCNQENEEAVQNGKRIRNAVIAIMFGREDQIDKSYFSGDFDIFREQVLKFYNKLTSKTNGRGLTILDTNIPIYGEDYNGLKLSSEADIIATDGTRIYVIDVRYSFLSIRDIGWKVRYPNATFTIEEHVTRRVKQIEQIINNKFKRQVNGLYCLPVVYNPSDEILSIEYDQNGSELIEVKAEFQDPTDNIESQKVAAEQLVSNINKNISEYNEIAKEARKYEDIYQPIDNIKLLQYESGQEYADYLNSLHAQYDTLTDRIDEMRTLINQRSNLYDEVWLQSIPTETEQQPIEVSTKLNRLSTTCTELSFALEELSTLPITTDVERNNLQKFIDVLFEAQIALDDLLQDKDASVIDVTPEESLITKAVETLALNKEVLGKEAAFARRWWATQFAIGPSTNTSETAKSESEIFFGYINKILSWVDTIQKEVLPNIADNEALLQWYCSVINYYFNELLNNAEKFGDEVLQDAAQKSVIQNSVRNGRALIEEFNSLYDTRPDEEFTGPITSPADKVNRMPTKWKDLYGWTNSIMPSFNEMGDFNGIGKFYYWLSISPTFLDSKFVLSQRRDGKLQLYIEGITLDGKTRNVTLTFENDLSKAPAEDLERWLYVNIARQKFIRKAIAALNFVKENPGYEIRFDKSTNKGQILYEEDGTLHPVTQWLFTGNDNKHDLYTIKLSKNDRMGILVRLSGDNVSPDTYNVRGGDNLMDDIGGFDRDYLKLKLHTQSGAIVYFYNTGNNQYIGVPIQSNPIGQDSASKLVYLIEKYMSGDRTDQYGFDIMDLLKMRLYIADPERKLSRRNNTNNMITINDGSVTIGDQQYDIVSGKKDLIERISTMPNVTRGIDLNKYLRTSNNSVLSRVRTLFGQSSLDKMLLTNGLVFDKEDFTHKNTGTNVQDGSTWLGYMLRNGLLGTSAYKMGYKELRISNIRVVPKGFGEEKPLQQEIKQAQNKPKVVVRGDDFFDKLAKLRKIVDASEMQTNRSTEEQESFTKAVQDYFDKILGDNGKVEFTLTDKSYFDKISENERVAGVCSSAIIEMSKFAPFSTAWHEAFHKVFELVIPAKTRDEFYNAYKHSIYGFFKNPSDRDIAEAFADMYMNYMQNKQDLDKADSLFKKFKPWWRSFTLGLGMTWRMGYSKMREMYRLYNEINNGEYKSKPITEEQNRRFKELFNDQLFYTVTNTDSKVSANFSNLADIGDRDKLVRALSYYILKTFGIDELTPNITKVKITGGTLKDKPTLDKVAEMYGSSVEEFLKGRHPVFEEVFEKVEKEYTTKDGKVIKKNFYPKFEALSRHIADYISTIFDTMRKPKIEEDETITKQDTQDEESEGIDFKASDTDHWDKAAYEFSKLDGLMDRVKLFFGTIPYGVYQQVEDENGNLVKVVGVDYSRNKFGSPEFMPVEEVWNLIVNKFNTASSIEELDRMLEEHAGEKEVYAQVYAKFHSLVEKIYKKNEEGKIIVAQTDFDKESLALQILSAIQSQKNTFLVALSEKQDLNDQEGKSIRIVESSMDRDSRSYPDQWTQYLVSGQIGVFERERAEGNVLDSEGRKKKTVLVFKQGMGGTKGNDIFSKTAKFFIDARTQITGSDSDVTIDGIKYNLNDFEDISRIKDEIVHKLNTIGIMLERDAFDYMLSELYGGVDAESIRRFLNDSPVSNDPLVIETEKLTTLQSFIDKINQYVTDQGVIRQDLIENEGYGKIGFVNKLAKWQGRYKRISSQNMAYALNGKKLYSISQNNSISHIIKQLNTADLDNETIACLSRFGYNVTRDNAGIPIGSIILKSILNREPMHIEGFTYIGFKTDNKGDQGSEYTDESTVEDYMAKMAMLQQGYLIFPTLADKSTWMLMNGVPIPGMRFIDTKDSNGNPTTMVLGAPQVRIIAGKPYLIPNDRVLDQMIEYAKTEMLAIQQCMEDLGYDKIPGYEKTGRKILSDAEKVGNYHKKNGNIEPNGTRFLSLTKVVTNEYDPKTQSYKLVEHNLNDPRESSTTLLQRAQDVFFARREGESIELMIERQREAMALTLAILTLNEVNTAVDLGIVQKKQYQAQFGSRTVVMSRDDISLLNLDTKDLNASQVQALYRHIMNTTKTKSGILWKDVPNDQQRAFYSNMARSLAIAGILQDATNRHIICSLEVQRCFSGHPAFFKVKYNSTGIKDSAFDIQKRIGGMVSTGEDNIIELPGINRQYTCAECEDYEVGSTSNIANRLLSMFSESNARYIFGVRTNAWDDAYNLSIEELIEKYPEQKKLIEDQQKRGSDYAKAFTKGINVADGASYITADMCRDMLRMRGAYTNKVRKAFKILMSSSKYNWTQVAKSYKTVYEAINVVPTKYTAYGFRSHILNGNQVSDIAVAYYNKFALFPVFPCMATGKMKGVYDKMLSEGVEMLLMTSAVKLGSQGAVSYDGTEISAPFNKYVQDYAYLRRQLNTDPEEEGETHIGTQMVKIGLSNLVKERVYKDLNGNDVHGDEILTQMMESINLLAKIGALEVVDMFTTDGTIDYEKMSEYLKEQLTTRNANKTIILAILFVKDKSKLSSPLAATTDASWIESIFISTMNKHIVDITTPGKSFVQRSVFAMEGNTQEGEGSIQSDEGMAPTLNRGLKLQMINEEGSMDAVISIDYFLDILPKDLSFDQAKQWLIDKGIISGYRTNVEDMSQEWNNAKAMMIGYRIPTQAQSSIHALRIVDVLPATKTTIILPEEFTKITGSDFDIDHLYLASFNFNISDEEDNITEASTVFDETENASKYHLNRILESLMILLKDTENSLNHLYKPIDNDTELITNVSDYIQESGSTKGEPYNFGTLHELVIRKNDYITGKKGIGPFALNSTGHVLCRQFGVKFNSTKLVQATRLADLDTRLDKDDNPIESWLSGFINAHVDIVKDPYISRLNVNQFTYNTLNLMIRCGWGDTALWFLANPLIRAMSQANDLADSQYMKRPSKNKSGKTYREELVYNAVKEFLNDEEISDEKLDWLINNKKALDDRIMYINSLDKTQTELKEAAISGKVDHDTALRVFYAWKILEKYSRSLGNLVQHTKVDTRKYGKNFIAVQKYHSDYVDIFRPEDTDGSMWDLKSLQNFETGSWIKTKTDLVAELPKRIFGGQTFNANPRFVNAVIKFAKELERDGQEMSADDVVMLSRHLQTAIKSKYFVQYAREVLNMSDKDIADLFIGYKSMNRQLVSLKYLIANDPAYARLANNPFLNQIYSMLEDRPVFANGRGMSDRPGFVTVLDNVDDSKLNSDLLSEGWLDLMNDEDSRIRKFARKMVLYAFFSSGEFNGWNKLMKYVPYEWIAGEVDLGRKSYSTFIEEELQAVSDDYSDLYDDIVANNFMDYRFAEQTDGTNEDGSLNFLNTDRGVKIGKGVSADQVKELSKYVSIRRKGMRAGHLDSYELYKLIDVVKAGKNYHPVYAKIKKRGYHTRGNDIYEYGWNFNYAENENKASDTFDYDAALKRVEEYLENGQLESFSEANVRAINRVYAGLELKERVAPQKLDNVDWEFMEYSGFSDPMYLTEEELKEAEEYKNICEGGN